MKFKRFLLNYRNLRREGALLLLVLFGLGIQINVAGLQGEIQEFSTAKCESLKCFHLRARTAYTGLFDSSYSLNEVSLELGDLSKHNSGETINASEAFFDPKAQKIFLRGIADRSYNEALYDLREQRLYEFKSKTK